VGKTKKKAVLESWINNKLVSLWRRLWPNQKPWYMELSHNSTKLYSFRIDFMMLIIIFYFEMILIIFTYDW